MAELEQKAGYGLVIALSITAMIGTGMFFGPAIAAQWAGNASIVAWVVLALITIYVGSCFAELSSMFPDVGGVYVFAKKAYGRFVSFLVGWVTWLVGSITPAVLIVASLEYLVPTIDPLYKIAFALGLIIMLNLVAFRGIEASTFILLFFAIITVGVILSVIIGGIPHVNMDNYTPFLDRPPIWILVALFFIMETFFGWESATFMGSETKNPSVIIPRSIMITTIIVAVLGVVFPVMILGIVPWETLVNWSAPLTNVSFIIFGDSLGYAASSFVNVAIFMALVGSAAGGIVSAPRLILALAKDKLFIEQLSAVHPKFKTPHKAIFFQTIVSLIVVLVAFGDYQSLLAMLVPLALIMYVSVIITVPILRRKFPDMKRTVRTPLATFGTIVVSIFYLSVIVGWLLLDFETAWPLFTKMLSFVLFGIPLYFLLSLYYNPDMLLKAVNSFAKLNVFLENITLPKKVRLEILSLFGDIEGRNVLEFGGGVGTLTLPMAEVVGVDGHIYITDLSPNNLDILHKRMQRRGHQHYSVIHDQHLISRVHPDVPAVDMIFSVGNLSYIQDMKRVLQDMHDLLPENGRICFVEYVDYFWGIIPNPPWLDDPLKIERLFREMGFSVRVRKRNGLLWKYLYIYGIKSDHDVPVI